MKKIVLTALIIIFLLAALPVLAEEPGFVPCGTKANPDPCTFQDFIILVRNVVNFLIFKLGVPAAAGALVIAGAIMASAVGDPGKISLAKKIIWTAVVGLVLMLAAWLIIKTIQDFLGAESKYGLPGGFGQ